MSRPFFSICLPTYNGARTIRNAVEAVIGQTFADWHLTIIDDGSTDGTWEILNREYGALPQIRLVRNEKNLGLRGNLNRCLQLAEGKWLGILAQDDAYRLHTLETIHRQLSERSDVVLWTHGQLIHDGENPPVALPVYRTVTEFSAYSLAKMTYRRGNQFGVLSSYFLSLDSIRQGQVSFADGEMLVDQRFYLRLLMRWQEKRAIYWPDLLTYTNVDENTESHRLTSSGKAAIDNIEQIGDLAGLGWSRAMLFYQLSRVIYLGIKFRRTLVRCAHGMLPFRVATNLCRELVRPTPRT